MPTLHSLLSLLLLVSITTAILPLTLPNTLSKPTAFSQVISQGEGVDTDKHPDWAGNWDPEDCIRAQGLFNGRISYWDPAIRWTFWSRRWETMPEGQQWELPFGTRYRERALFSPPGLSVSFPYLTNFYGSLAPYSKCSTPQSLPTLFIHSSRKKVTLVSNYVDEGIGTCTIILRMGKDFGDHVIPHSYKDQIEYMRLSRQSPEAVLSWNDIIPRMQFSSSLIRIGGHPKWSGIGERMGGPLGGWVYALFVPSKSAIARVWTEGMRATKNGVGEVLFPLGNETGVRNATVE